ncbi:MAG: glycine betaine ABC transporter substrate-binding protein [bacterium]|nr:glycine betaine ABC transporter substrate-binding protein [bacterium]
MKSLLFKLTNLLFISIFATGLFTGCSTSRTESDAKTVKLAYVNWADAVAITSLAQAILEDKMGYHVKTMMADVAPVFTSIAQGDNDAFLDVWLPVTHDVYLKEYGDRIVDLGAIYSNARIGLVVPSYVPITSIEELNGSQKNFRGQIIGIDSGSGIMRTTEKAIEVYGLNLNLISSSGPAMAAALQSAIDNNEWIAVTGWRPHWKFSRWSLKFLDDPKGVYGQVEQIHAYARKNLEKDKPRVTRFLRKYSLTDAQLSGLMERIKEGSGESVDAARIWMKENEEIVNAWLPAKE